MSQDFDLTSQKWLSLVFEGKNKEYGAYELRAESSDRHIKALVIVTIIGLAAVFLPNIIKSVIPVDSSIEIKQTGPVTLIDVDEKVTEVNPIVKLEIPQPLKATIAFTPPVIVNDESISEKDLMEAQQTLTDTQAAISIATVDGTKDGIDIVDVVLINAVVEEPKKDIPTHVEVMPTFPGGEKELLAWLSKNIEYPAPAIELGISGKVILRFVVLPDGSVSNVEIQKSLDPNCDKEAVRAVKKMPKWIPGRQNGNPVSVYYSLPVTFRLQN